MPRIIKRFCWIENNKCFIPINNGEVATCDEDRFAEVDKHNWFLSNLYPATNIKGKVIRLHKFLYPEIKMIDHINSNKLDNRSCNLRACNATQNAQNQSIKSTNKTGFKGVYLHFFKKSYVAQIRINGKTTYLGIFKTAIEAAKKYDEKAKKVFGKFAVLNFMD